VPDGRATYGHKAQNKVPALANSPVHDDADDDYSFPCGGPVGSPSINAPNDYTQARPHYERQCARSILLSKLPDNTTHGDITDAVRGGQLLDIFLRSNDRTAAVSFLLAADARAFFDHVKRRDLYINQKRVSGISSSSGIVSYDTDVRQVDIRWNDRQFILPGHVASKVGIGATRNLIIRRCDPRFTESVDVPSFHRCVLKSPQYTTLSSYLVVADIDQAGHKGRS
jgi:hypothetical protein